MKTATKEKTRCPECGGTVVMTFMGNITDPEIAKKDVLVCITPGSGCSAKFFMKDGKPVRVDENVCTPFKYHVKVL